MNTKANLLIAVVGLAVALSIALWQPMPLSTTPKPAITQVVSPTSIKQNGVTDAVKAGVVNQFRFVILFVLVLVIIIATGAFMVYRGWVHR